MLTNLSFYFVGMTRIWFESHEEEVTSWDLCKQKLTDFFGKTVGCWRPAQKDLVCQVQTCTESYVTYIQD